MNNLLESYKGRLSIAEKYYAQKNGGEKLSSDKKLLTAMCINNVAKFINESFVPGQATQRSAMGDMKRFCLDITNIAVPSLIAADILMVKPMASYTGYLIYLQFELSADKGGVKAGDVINNPWTLGEMKAERFDYTSERIAEPIVEAKAADVYELAWGPVRKVMEDAAGVKHDYKIVRNSGAVVFGDLVNGKVHEALGIGDRVCYVYDNQQIPAAKLPTLRGVMKGIVLEAKARRIAIEYSQFAAFETKNDYGIDFESAVAQQAQSELQFEIDGEAIEMLRDAADARVAAHAGELVEWTDGEKDMISYSMKAEGFARAVEQCKQNIFKNTNRFLPNWMIISPDMMPVLTFVPGFKVAQSAIVNGAYKAGNALGLDIYVSPILGEKVCYLGVKASDGKTAAGVFAPYMPLVPTQLLGFADGTMSKGFSSMYDMKVLNDCLLGKILVHDNKPENLLGQVQIYTPTV